MKELICQNDNFSIIRQPVIFISKINLACLIWERSAVKKEQKLNKKLSFWKIDGFKLNFFLNRVDIQFANVKNIQLNQNKHVHTYTIITQKITSNIIQINLKNLWFKGNQWSSQLNILKDKHMHVFIATTDFL